MTRQTDTAETVGATNSSQEGRSGLGDELILERIATIRIVPVVELPTVGAGQPLLEALLEGGLPAAEITLRTTAGVEAISTLRRSYPDALIGAGTVRTLEDVDRVGEAGAQFVVSPAVNLDLIAACRAAGITVIPGACTPTEVDAAVRAGAAAVKFFPAEAMGGLAFLRALAAPFRDVSFIPTGGINARNLREYLRHAQVLACGGSWMVTPALVREGRFDIVTALAREAVAIAKEAEDAAAA